MVDLHRIANKLIFVEAWLQYFCDKTTLLRIAKTKYRIVMQDEVFKAVEVLFIRSHQINHTHHSVVTIAKKVSESIEISSGYEQNKKQSKLDVTYKSLKVFSLEIFKFRL